MVYNDRVTSWLYSMYIISLGGKIMKKLLCILLSFMVMMGCMVHTMAEENSIMVILDGNQLEFDVEPMLIGGRTMVPLRAIFEALGATVSWDEATRTVTAYNEAYYVNATMDNQEMYVNGQARRMDIAPMIVNGRTLVPVRFIAEAFNCKVDWNGASKTVSISSTAIDYGSLEQKTEQSTENEKIPNTKEEKAESSVTYGKYYSGTNVPDYTAVTGVKLKNVYKNSTGSIYQYPDTQVGTYSEVVDYMGYLMNSCGWSSYKTDEKADHITWYYVKGSVLIGVSFYAKYDEIWIMVAN